jgi:hypothetical protein
VKQELVVLESSISGPAPNSALGPVLARRRGRESGQCPGCIQRPRMMACATRAPAGQAAVDSRTACALRGRASTGDGGGPGAGRDEDDDAGVAGRRRASSMRERASSSCLQTLSIALIIPSIAQPVRMAASGSVRSPACSLVLPPASRCVGMWLCACGALLGCGIATLANDSLSHPSPHLAARRPPPAHALFTMQQLHMES